MDGGRFFDDVLQHAQLRSVAVLEKHFLPAVVIEIGQGERAAVFQKIEIHGAGNIGKCSVAIVRVEDVALVAAPGVVGADQFIDRVPSLFVIRGRLGGIGRIGHHLAPEETVQIFANRARKSFHSRCRDRESRRDRNPRRRSTTTIGPCPRRSDAVESSKVPSPRFRNSELPMACLR